MHTVGDLMTRELVTLDETDDLGLASAITQLGRLRHLPVVRDGKLVGLVTHRDILRIWARRGEDSGRRALAREVMVRDVMRVYPHTLLRDALQRMLTHKYGCLPVVASEEDDTLVGILTETDLLRYAAGVVQELDHAARWGQEEQPQA